MHVTVRESWTDERLDDLKERVDDGFERMEGQFDRIDARFDRIDARIDRVDSRIDSMSKSFIVGVIAMSSTLIAGFGALTAVIATKL
jgi:hypothetical protein